MYAGTAVVLPVLMAVICGCGHNDPGDENRETRKPPELKGRLAYQRGEGKKSEIYVMDLSSRRSVRLTDNDVLDEYPRWSPDGKHIAFYSDRDGARRIYVMTGGGKDIRKVTDRFRINEDPSWSPDGGELCFWAQADKKSPENLFIIKSDGSGMRNITNSSKGTRRVPAWSPDGREIAFTSDKFLSHEIYTIDPRGRNEKRLTGNPRGACRPRWSPDGKRIAYSDGGYSLRKNVDIWEMDPDGGNKKRLTENPRHDYDPAYAPDGKRIIFASDRSGHYELYVMDRDGSNEARLTEFNGYTRYPDWTR